MFLPHREVVALRLLFLTNFSHAYALIREPTFINFKVYFMCFNDPLRTYGASTINNMILILLHMRGLRLILFFIFPKAMFILEPTFINS